MIADTKRWRACVWLRELVRQWHAARGDPAGADFQRPFSRNWEELLEAASLISGEARSEAFREAQSLQALGLIILKTDRYRPYQIERIVVPFIAEPRLHELFSDELPGKPDSSFDPSSIVWASQLKFLSAAGARITVSPDDLLRLNMFFLSEGEPRPVVPIKERSIEIFENEKRLDALFNTSLFRGDRLDLKRHLSCEIIGEPLAWKRGPAEAAALPLIVIENAATWHSYSRWNAERKLFSAVVYGGGDRFVEGVRYLSDIFEELGEARRIFYFGDLDPRGLLIPQEASARGQSAGFPSVEAHLWSYRHLFAIGAGRPQPWEGEIASPSLCDWLGELADDARQLFGANQRLAQERIGWELLKEAPSPERF